MVCTEQACGSKAAGVSRGMKTAQHQCHVQAAGTPSQSVLASTAGPVPEVPNKVGMLVEKVVKETTRKSEKNL